MKIVVISGTLGAGKTTFIKNLSKITRRDYCVLENEFGSVNVDRSLLKEDKNPINVYELTEGCICCSTKGEFASSVLTIANSIDPDHLLVEPTGVAYLSSIRKNLSKISYERIAILDSICIADGTSLLSVSKNYTDLELDQLKNAKHIVVSKSENYSESEKSRVRQEILNINPSADIFIGDYTKNPTDWFLNLLSSSSLSIQETPIRNSDS
ncbi:MAG: GTP-binding protein [Bacilli bacterium]